MKPTSFNSVNNLICTYSILTCNHFVKKFLSSRDTRLEGDSMPSQSITQ